MQQLIDRWVTEASGLFSEQGLEDSLARSLAFGIGVNTLASSGLSALHAAAIAGNSISCRFLIRAGADLHQLDSERRSPLLLAAAHGHWSLCAELVRAGASPLDRDPHGRSVWLLAASSFGFFGARSLALALGSPLPVSDVDFSGHNGLMLSALSGKTLDASDWVGAGLDPRAQNHLGWSALTCLCAATLRSTHYLLAESAQSLLDAGVPASLPTHLGASPAEMLRRWSPSQRSLIELLERAAERETLETAAQAAPSTPSPRL